MKTTTLLFAAFLQFSFLAAQNDSVRSEEPLFMVQDITKKMSKGEQPGFKIEIQNAKKKTVADALIKAMKEENKAKLELVNNEYFVPNAILKSISTKPINVYMILNEYETHVEMLMFFEMDSAFLTKEKNETEYLSARKATRDFAIKAYRGAVQERIDEEAEKLKGMENELDKIYKEHDNLQKKINEEKQNIDNTKEKISTSELDQERVRKQVQDQKASVSSAKSAGNETLLKEEEKKLKSLESELSKLQKQEDGFHKDITNGEANIRDLERGLSDNETSAKMKQEDVAKQKEVINNLQKKLATVY